jgi:hypothetical protein
MLKFQTLYRIKRISEVTIERYEIIKGGSLITATFQHHVLYFIRLSMRLRTPFTIDIRWNNNISYELKSQ